MQPIARIHPGTESSSNPREDDFAATLGSKLHGERLVHLARLATAAHMFTARQEAWMKAGPFSFAQALNKPTNAAEGGVCS